MWEQAHQGLSRGCLRKNRLILGIQPSGEGCSDSKSKPGCLKPYQLITDPSSLHQPLPLPSEVTGAHQAQLIPAASFPCCPSGYSVWPPVLSAPSLSLGHCCTYTSLPPQVAGAALDVKNQSMHPWRWSHTCPEACCLGLGCWRLSRGLWLGYASDFVLVTERPQSTALQIHPLHLLLEAFPHAF